MNHRVRHGSFATRLGLTFALIAAMTAVLAGAISYVAWSMAFENYVRKNLESTATYVATHAGSAYLLFDGWDFSYRAMIPQVAPRQDVIVQIFDNNDRLIYDESIFNPVVRDATHELFEVHGERELDASNDDVITAPIIVDFVHVGEVRVYAYGSIGMLTAHDVEMRNTSLIALAAAGAIAVAVSTIIGLSYSRSLVTPISKVTQAAQHIRDGDESARSELQGDDEIAQLGITFDKMADAIQRARERDRRVAGDVAHELRTPLQGIQATVEAIEDGVYPADSKHLGIILNETQRLTGLTNSILELSRLEAGTSDFVQSLIDLNNPVQAAIAVNSARIESTDLHLRTQLSDQGLIVMGSAERLQQAVTNLLTNSIRYTPTGGTITVKTFAAAGRACVSVTDTGIGMTQTEIDQVFERFWRADSARDRATGGIGIGMPITREIVDRHDGEIVVESEKGVGTTFTIQIPLEEP